MTIERLNHLLYECTDIRADARLSEISGALVMTSITSGDAFWEASRAEQILYALCCVMHHAGANGLQAMWDNNEGNAAAVMAAAVEGLELIGDAERHLKAAEFWQQVITRAGAPLVERFSAGTREDFDAIEQAVSRAEEQASCRDEPGIFEGAEMEQLSIRGFLACWDTDFPERVLVWLRVHEAVLGCSLSRQADLDRLIADLDRQDINSWVPDMNLGRPAFDRLGMAVLSGKLTPHQLRNGLHLLFRLRGAAGTQEVFDLFVRLSLHPDEGVRAEALKLAIGVFRLHQPPMPPPVVFQAHWEVFQQALALGVVADVARLVQDFLGNVSGPR